jgi:hypothetical protein
MNMVTAARAGSRMRCNLVAAGMPVQRQVRHDGPKEGVLVAWDSPPRASRCCWR